MTIAKLICRGLEEQDWTHEELARAIRAAGATCTRQAIGHWLRDQYPPVLPRIPVLNAIAEIFGWTPAERAQALAAYGLGNLVPAQDAEPSAEPEVAA